MHLTLRCLPLLSVRSAYNVLYVALQTGGTGLVPLLGRLQGVLIVRRNCERDSLFTAVIVHKVTGQDC